jgi:chemotaxis protein MotB
VAAEKKGQTIIIKKITIVAGGHGGAWKVALADFMTAMMAFFLVMWLLGQNEETKKAVSDYFSTPSIIEYNFQNFGVEITLEKLFLDLINEPLKAFQQFLEPIDKTPNLLDMGSEKVVAAYMADQLGDAAKNFEVSPDGFEFDIIDTELFGRGTSVPNANFVGLMDKLKAITTGLEEAEVYVTSRLFFQSVPGSDPEIARGTAAERLSLVRNRIEAGLESSSVNVNGAIAVQDKKDFIEGQSSRPLGMINIRIKQKPIRSDGKEWRKLEKAFGKPTSEMSVYENFVKQAAEQKSKKENN